jgi:hypothetical protein
MPLTKAEQRVGTTITGLAIILFAVYVFVSTVGMRNESAFLLFIGITLVVTIGISFVITRKFRREGNAAAIDYLNIGAQRYLLGVFMIFYGLPKLFGTFFDYQLFALDSKLKAVSEFELAWYFYGKNKWQELFAGIMEFVPGILLLNRRTYYVAALLLLPVTGQVFVLNFFFKIGGITFPAALVLLACNLYIVYSQREKIVSFFKSLDFRQTVPLSRVARVAVNISKWAIIILVFLIVYRNVKRNFFKPGDGVNYDKLVGVYSLDTMDRNGVAYTPLSDSLIYSDLYIEKQSRWNILRRSNKTTDAFVMKLNPSNDSISVYINKGGIGDGADILDSLTVLKGIYRLDGEKLTIHGIQLGDTLDLRYVKQDVKPKAWFW